MKKQISILALSFSLISFGINAQHSNQSKENQTAEKSATKKNPEIQKQLETVFKANLNLNDAFVASDASKVKAAVKPVKEAISKIGVSALNDKKQADWSTFSKELNNFLNQIESAENIKEQRRHFSAYNETLYKGIKDFGVGGEKVYLQHCPMALNNQGASWVSNTKEIRNPYFGDKMLKCGVVKETL